MVSRFRWLPAFVAGLALSGGVAVATGTDDQINACVGPAGHLRVSPDGACLPGESALSWTKSAKGEKGDKGEPGAPGTPGPRGLQGPAGNGSTLTYHAYDDGFGSTGSDTLTEIPGTRFEVDVPENALVSIGGQADATLDRNGCDWTEGYVIAIDLANRDYAVAFLSGNLRLAPPPEDPSPLPPVSGADVVRLRHAPRGVALPASARAAELAAEDDQAPAEDLQLSFVGDGLGYYEPMSTGRHELALFQYVYGDKGDDFEPCPATLHSSRHRVWVNVLEPEAAG